MVLEKGRERLEIVASGKLVVDDDDAAMVEAALTGAGFAYLTGGYAEMRLARGALVQLSDSSPAMPTLALYYPSRRRASPRLRAFVDFLQAQTRGARGRARPGRRGARN